MFCLKLETAYEVRISDWSSDVCSSDLQPFAAQHRVAPGAPTRTGRGSRAMANAGADKPARIFRDYDQDRKSTAELQSLMRISYAVVCLKKKNTVQQQEKKATHSQKQIRYTNTTN